MDETDVEWFQKQADTERLYDIFYEKPVTSVWISILYVKNNDIVYIKRVQQPVYDSILTQSYLEEFVSRNRLLKGSKYKFQTMANYNVAITPKQILNSSYSTKYFTAMDKLQDISLLDTISYLEDDNELFIVLSLHEKPSTTKRVKFTHNRKTRRKQ